MLNQIKIVGAFLTALAVGNATFFVTFRGKKYSVNLLMDGAANAPLIPAIPALTNAAFTALTLGGATMQIKVGSRVWSVVVEPA